MHAWSVSLGFLSLVAAVGCGGDAVPPDADDAASPDADDAASPDAGDEGGTTSAEVGPDALDDVDALDGEPLTDTAAIGDSELDAGADVACVPTIPVSAAEPCNDQDDDCNGLTDEGCDVDHDGVCSALRTTEGTPAICPGGGGDCDDSDRLVAPGAGDRCGYGDSDCDGVYAPAAMVVHGLFQRASYFAPPPQLAQFGDDALLITFEVPQPAASGEPFMMKLASADGAVLGAPRSLVHDNGLGHTVAGCPETGHVVATWVTSGTTDRLWVQRFDATLAPLADPVDLHLPFVSFQGPIELVAACDASQEAYGLTFRYAYLDPRSFILRFGADGAPETVALGNGTLAWARTGGEGRFAVFAPYSTTAYVTLYSSVGALLRTLTSGGSGPMMHSSTDGTAPELVTEDFWPSLWSAPIDVGATTATGLVGAAHLLDAGPRTWCDASLAGGAAASISVGHGVLARVMSRGDSGACRCVVQQWSLTTGEARPEVAVRQSECPSFATVMLGAEDVYVATSPSTGGFELAQVHDGAALPPVHGPTPELAVPDASAIVDAAPSSDGDGLDLTVASQVGSNVRVRLGNDGEVRARTALPSPPEGCYLRAGDRGRMCLGVVTTHDGTSFRDSVQSGRLGADDVWRVTSWTRTSDPCATLAAVWPSSYDDGFDAFVVDRWQASVSRIHVAADGTKSAATILATLPAEACGQPELTLEHGTDADAWVVVTRDVCAHELAASWRTIDRVDGHLSPAAELTLPDDAAEHVELVTRAVADGFAIVASTHPTNVATTATTLRRLSLGGALGAPVELDGAGDVARVSHIEEVVDDGAWTYVTFTRHDHARFVRMVDRVGQRAPVAEAKPIAANGQLVAVGARVFLLEHDGVRTTVARIEPSGSMHTVATLETDRAVHVERAWMSAAGLTLLASTEHFTSLLHASCDAGAAGP
ncbi:MAG: hypothetical protein U1F43_30050 [Myxococcota bacterium]